jgi:hypothetical protein
MAKAKKKVKQVVDDDVIPSSVRAFRMDDEVHSMLKAVAKAENRKIGHQLMQIIRRAYAEITVKTIA